MLGIPVLTYSIQVFVFALTFPIDVYCRRVDNLSLSFSLGAEISDRYCKT